MSKINVDRRYQPWAWLALALGLLGLSFWLGAALFSPSGSHAPRSESNNQPTDQPNNQTWTCSMHPQIQRDEPGDCPICGMDLIPMAQNLNADPTILTMSPAAVAMARVQTSAVRASLTATDEASAAAGGTLTLSGRLSTDERLAAVQSAHVAGRIERLFVNFEGERVRAGQALATIYSPELITAQRELIEALKFRELNPALLEASRQKLRNLKISSAEIAEIEASGEVRTSFTVKADQTGVVIDQRVKLGDYVMPGEPLMMVTRLDQLWVLLDAYEGDFANIRIGDRISFTTPAVPGQTFTARVSFIDPLIDPQTRTATIRAEVSNPGGVLKPEMFVRAELSTRTPKVMGAAAVAGTYRGAPGAEPGSRAPLYVPATAILWTGKRSVAYVEVPDAEVPSYEFREVTLGQRSGESYAVVEGLRLGERVVTHGAFSIDAAAQLNNQFSMMNRNVRIEGAKQTGVVTGGVSEVALPDYRLETPDKFKTELAAVAKTYLAVKDALVAGNATAVSTVIKGFGESLQTVDMALLKGDAHLYWMQQLGALQTHSKDLAKASVLADQREQFGYLSQAIINTLKVFGVSGPTLYVDHCPMAFDGKGANWVSAQEGIKNPYYGDAMLKCGSVVEILNE